MQLIIEGFNPLLPIGFAVNTIWLQKDDSFFFFFLDNLLTRKISPPPKKEKEEKVAEVVKLSKSCSL